MPKPLRILLVDDDQDEYILLQGLLADLYKENKETTQRMVIEWVNSFEAAIGRLEQAVHDVYLVDYRLGPRNGLDLLNEVLGRGVQAPFILLTGHGSYDLDVEAMRRGATDYLVKGEVSAPLLERTIRYALERKRTEETFRRNAERAGLLASLSQAFAEAGLDYTKVLNTIARRIAETFEDACVIRLLSEDEKFLRAVAYFHPDPEIQARLSEVVLSTEQPAETGLIGQVFTRRQAALIPATQTPAAAPLFTDWPYASRLDLHSLLVVPLNTPSRALGTLAMLRMRPHQPFTREDQHFFQDMGERAALAIENAGLYRDVAQRANELNALHNATTSLLTTLDLETLLARILDAVQQAVPAAEHTALYLLTPGNSSLQIHATQRSQHDPRIHQLQLSGIGFRVASMIRRQQPICIDDLEKEPGLVQNLLPNLPESLRSVMIAPLLDKNAPLGMLTLTSSRPGVFTNADLRLLLSIAATTAVALQNARLHAEVQRLAVTDSLTGLHNRRGFFVLGRRELERARRFGRPLAVIMVDIDHFKEINDTLGHAAGDQVLRTLAERLRGALREVDIVGRYGGDEFIVLLPEAGPEMAVSVAERLREKLADPIKLSPSEGGTPLRLTASMGVANTRPQDSNLKGLINQADLAAYKAKRNGRNRVEIQIP